MIFILDTGGRLSRVTQEPRADQTQGPPGSDEHWSVLVFESLSVGVMVVLFVMLAVMLLVGVYTTVVWPLTFWDLTDSGLEKYGSWVKTVLWSLFAGGSLAGYWCISGAAFKQKAGQRRTGLATRGIRSTRR